MTPEFAAEALQRCAPVTGAHSVGPAQRWKANFISVRALDDAGNGACIHRFRIGAEGGPLGSTLSKIYNRV